MIFYAFLVIEVDIHIPPPPLVLDFCRHGRTNQKGGAMAPPELGIAKRSADNWKLGELPGY